MKKPINTKIVAFSVVATAVVVLFGLIPYYTGYYPPKKTLAKGMWQLANYRSGEWTHCMFVPFIVAGLLWYKRKDFHEIAVQPSWMGLPVLIFCGFLYWVGYRSDMHYFGWMAVHGFIAGSILWLLGWSWLRSLFFHLAFLTFMWPLLFLESTLAVPLRYVMVETASKTMTIFGIENLRQGTAIFSAADPGMGLGQGERFQLDVADPCSGIRSLFALMMISALYGFMTLKGFWKRLLLFSSSLPLAIAGNLVRILLLLIGTLTWGSEFAIGPENSPSIYHLGAGFAVFVVALVGMVTLGGIVKNGLPWLRKRKAVTRVVKGTQSTV